ncbi:MAG: hypothetical protein A2046_09820 [Bacteroidetes bacterium GWA2_30_7]|nr:MAG: hypothetical protein A2046_09820 [Bacteroidetes bacterium GWA2_30_7]
MEKEAENIIEKVAFLYLKYGIKSITMDDVARELGISKKTLYNYFNDKTDLVSKVMDSFLSFHDNKSEHISGKNLNAIEEIFEVNIFLTHMLKEYNPSMAYDLKKYYPDIYKHFYEVRRDKMYNSVLANLKKGKREGLFRKEMNEEIIAKLHVSRIEGIFESNVFTVEEFTSPEFVFEIFNYHIRGIVNEKGLEMVNNKIKELKKINKNE